MGKRILLADDSVTIQKVVELTFMDEDYEVVSVSNGDEAVASLEEVQPDVVIADIHMPGANGYEVCRKVKQWRPGTPVLLLVGTFEPFQEQEARSAGADGHLKKPFDSQELLQRVEVLLTSAAPSASVAPAVAKTPAEEMELWQASDALPEEEEGGELYAEGVPGEEPAGPLGQEVPTELVLEASPWTEAEEGEAARPWESAAPEPAPAAPLVAPEPPVASPPPVFASPSSVPGGAAPVAPAVSAPAPPAVPAVAAVAATGNGGLSEGDVERIARRVVELLGDQLVREVAWEVVPDMAELVIKDRLRELERQLEGT